MSDAEQAPVIRIQSAGSAIFGLRAALAAREFPFRIEAKTEHGHIIREQVALGGADADIVIVPAAEMDDLAAKSHLAAESVRDIGFTGIGYAVRAGHPLPALADPASVLRAVREAKSLFLTTAPTGVHVRAALEKADASETGFNAALQRKLRLFDRATEMMAALAKDETGALSFGPTTELAAWSARGVAYGGVVPAPYDLPLEYRIAVLRSSPRIGDATAIAAWLAGPEGLKHFRTSGVT